MVVVKNTNSQKKCLGIGNTKKSIKFKKLLFFVVFYKKYEIIKCANKKILKQNKLDLEVYYITAFKYCA